VTMPGKGEPEPRYPWSASAPNLANLTRRWVRLCVLWYVCGLATGIVLMRWLDYLR